MPKTDIRTDIQPSWLELPEEVYWCCVGRIIQGKESALSDRYTLSLTPADAIRSIMNNPAFQYEGYPPISVTLSHAMRVAASHGLVGVRVIRFVDGVREVLATYDVADYFGGDHA